jgi:hypothetical protein
MEDRTLVERTALGVDAVGELTVAPETVRQYTASSKNSWESATPNDKSART